MDINYRKYALFRLNYWTNINYLSHHDSRYFWSQSNDHRIISILAVNAAFNQIPLDLAIDKSRRNIINFLTLRRMCRCSDKTMRVIIQDGVDRGEIERIKEGRETLIKATKLLIDTYRDFEKDWILFYGQDYIKGLSKTNYEKIFNKILLIRLKFFSDINSISHSFDLFWNKSVDHRIVNLLGVNSFLDQLPIEYSTNLNTLNKISYESLRRLCRCSDSTIKSIISEAIKRKELEKISEGRRIYIRGTNLLFDNYKKFEFNWINLIRENVLL